MKGLYDDIIDLPHHVSEKHPQMPMDQRAAQFSPFAALTGYGAVIRETRRLTDRRMELSESVKEELERKLRELCEKNSAGMITFFRPDKKKEGGAYISVEGIIRRIDDVEKVIILESGLEIPVDQIVDLEFADQHR